MVLLLIIGSNALCRAQYHIPFDSVAKITFIQKGYILSKAYLKVEVLPEGGAWKAYQTELHTEWVTPEVNVLDRKYLKDIPVATVTQLLEIVAKQDITFDVNRLGIDKQRLIDSIRTRYPALLPRQQAEFAKLINTDTFFNNWAKYVIDNPMFSDDPTHYYVFIQHRSGRADTLQAHANSSLDLLPWRLSNKKLYNPAITRAFTLVMGDEYITGTTDRVKYVEIAFQIYMKDLQVKFNWEEIRENYQVVYKLLSKNLKPVSMGGSVRVKSGPSVGKSYNSTFNVKGLPKYVQLKFTVQSTNNLANERACQYVDTLRRLFKRSNFLFEYLKKRSDASITFEPWRKAQYGERAYQSIRPYFPDIDKYEHKDIQVIRVKGKPDIESGWLLLPDNTLLLCYFLPDNWALKKDWIPQFMGLNKDLVCAHYPNMGYVCIHLDAKGKLIRDYGLAEHISFSNLF